MIRTSPQRSVSAAAGEASSRGLKHAWSPTRAGQQRLADALNLTYATGIASSCARTCAAVMPRHRRDSAKGPCRYTSMFAPSPRHQGDERDSEVAFSSSS